MLFINSTVSVLVSDIRSEFTDQLSHMSQSEAIFLLTTFANMATSRESHEKDFIEAITIEVFEVLLYNWLFERRKKMTE